MINIILVGFLGYHFGKEKINLKLMKLKKLLLDLVRKKKKVGGIDINIIYLELLE